MPGRRKKAIFHCDYSLIHALVTLLYWTLQFTLEYSTVLWRTWVMVASSNVAFKIAAKPLQTDVVTIHNL